MCLAKGDRIFVAVGRLAGRRALADLVACLGEGVTDLGVRAVSVLDELLTGQAVAVGAGALESIEAGLIELLIA